MVWSSILNSPYVLFMVEDNNMSLDNVVHIMTKLRAWKSKCHGSIHSRGQEILFFPPRMALRWTHFQFSWFQALFPGVKWPGHKTDHSSQSSAEITNKWMYISFPSRCMNTISEEKVSVCEQKNLHTEQTQGLLNDSPVSFPKIMSLKAEVGSVLFPTPLNVAVLSNIYSEVWSSRDFNPWNSFDMCSSQALYDLKIL